MSSQSQIAARPILKSRLNSIKSPRPTGKQVSLKVPSSPRPPSSKVHFPPTPTISIIFETHANEVYDRTSIVVSPSSTAIPWSKKNKFNISGRATAADIFCTPITEEGSKAEAFIKGGSSSSDYSDSEESDTLPELADATQANARSVRFAASPLRSPIPGRRTKFDLEKALSFLPHPPASLYPTSYPVSPYPRSPSFDPRSPSSDKDNKKGFGVIREATRVQLPALRRDNTTKPKVTVTAAKKASHTPRRRPAQLNLDTLTVPKIATTSPSVRFAPPGLLPVSPVPPRSINAVLDESESSDSGDSDSDSEEGRSLRAAFWRSMTLEKKNGGSTDGAAAAVTSIEAQALVSPAIASPFPVFLYKNLRSPALAPRKSRASAGDFMGNAGGFAGLMSPNTLGKNLEALTSPAPKDPAAAFTSFASAFASVA
jgi:hypothetical protein